MRVLFSLLVVFALAGCSGSSGAAGSGSPAVPMQGATVSMTDARLPFTTTTPPAFSVRAERGADADVYAFTSEATGASLEFHVPASAGFQNPVAYAQALAGDQTPTRQPAMGALDYVFSWTEGDAEVTVYSGVRSGRRFFFHQVVITPADQRAIRSILDAWTWAPDGDALL